MIETLITIIFWLGCTYYVYRDSELRPHNRAAWTVFTFFLPVIGIIAWLIFRKPKTMNG